MSTVRYITITFPEPVELSDVIQCDLVDLASHLCRQYVAKNPGRVMWPFGIGSPITSMPITAEDEAAGVPFTVDGAGFEIECSERADYKWPCALCGLPQGDHREHIIDPPAGDCPFSVVTDGLRTAEGEGT